MATNALTDMFTNTAGAFGGTPEINTTYYMAAPPQYIITYVTEHGIVPDPKVVTVTEGESYALTAGDLPTLSADGYIFGGWSVNGVIISTGYSISADAVLTAVWVEDSPVSKIDHASFMQGFFKGKAMRGSRV